MEIEIKSLLWNKLADFSVSTLNGSTFLTEIMNYNKYFNVSFRIICNE